MADSHEGGRVARVFESEPLFCVVFRGKKKAAHSHSDGKQGVRLGGSPEDGKTHLNLPHLQGLSPTAQQGPQPGLGHQTDISSATEGTLVNTLSRRTQPQCARHRVRVGTQAGLQLPGPTGQGSQESLPTPTHVGKANG